MNSVVDLPPLHTGKDLINFFLQEQQDLTAIEKFSKIHESNRITKQQKYYQELIPHQKPGKNQQLAFEVDLDSCTGCKACVTGCHSLNGLDKNETWRDVGLLLGEENKNTYQQTITTACHHCADPACMNGCPVLAYEKDPVTGIVRHLDDQCIGCQYCVLKCPYDVPKYNERIGIVRKCDMCFDRLENGEAPACVQSCPNSAIKITIVDTPDIEKRKEEKEFLPNAPLPAYTKPSTQYKTKKIIPAITKTADIKKMKLEHSHLPLVFMLIFTQICAGAYLFSIPSIFTYDNNLIMKITYAIATIISIHIAILHLGRPQFAYRALLGLRKSWLSREILAFGLFAKFAVMSVMISYFDIIKNYLNTLNLYHITNYSMHIGAAACGTLAVFTSIMVYHDTKRPFWNIKFTGFKFYTTMILGGIALTNLLMQIQGQNNRYLSFLLAGFIIVSFLKIIKEEAMLKNKTDPSIILTAYITTMRFDQVIKIRKSLLLLANVLCFAILMKSNSNEVQISHVTLSAFLVLLTICSELIERFLFFKTVVAPKMPGGL